MRKYGIIIIGIIFLVYGGVRFGVSSALLIQATGLIDVQDFQEPLIEIGAFLQGKNPTSLLAVSTVGYLCYLWLMGAALIVGAIGCLRNKKYGQNSIISFLAMYVLLFVNFQTINPKIIHLIACAFLFALYMWLRSGEDVKGSEPG